MAAPYKNWAVDAQGNVVGEAQVEVLDAEGVRASIFSNNAGAALSNPFSANEDGSFEFWAESGEYEIITGVSPTSSTIRAIIIDINAPFQPYRNRPAFVTAVANGLTALDGTIVWIDGLAYKSKSGATAISDLPGWVLAGDVTAEHFGGAVGRENASMATAALNAAADYCRETGAALSLREGSYFCNDVIDFSGIFVTGHGIGEVPHRSAYYFVLNEAVKPAKTQIVLTGSGQAPVNVYGISSMKACGAHRTFSAPRDDHNETDWDMVSLMKADATTGEATPKDLKVGILIDGLAAGHLEGFRVVPDGGGDDGLDAYNDEAVNELIGSIDIGILQLGGRSTTMADLQVIGNYRVGGYFNVAKPRDQDFTNYTAPYETTISRCLFQGMRAVALRGPDKFAIIDETSTTVDLPWADDHPFTTAPEQNVIRLVEVGTGTSAGSTFTYTGASKVNVGGEDRIRLSGLSGFASGGYGAVMSGATLGANSHIVFNDCQFGGLQLPSGYNPNDSANVSNPLTNGAIGGVEISGYACAEPAFYGCRIQHQGTVALYGHECREIVIDMMTECPGNRSSGTNGMRYITSPQHIQSPYAVYPVGGMRWIEWRYNVVLEYTGSSIDFRPFMPDVSEPSMYSDDNGWFETYWAIRPMMVRSYSPTGRLEAGSQVLRVGDGAEGVAGFAPAADLHVRRVGATADALIEATGSGDARLLMETEQRQARILLDDSSSDLTFQYDGNKDGAYENIGRYEGGASQTGWHWSAPSFHEKRMIGRLNLGNDSLTIASGGVTLPDDASFFSIDTEGGASSDDLANIDGGIAGDFIVIQSVSAARTVVIRDGVGAGSSQIFCENRADISLNHNHDKALLIHDGIRWYAKLWNVS